MTQENIRIVGRLLEDDRRITVAEIASEVGISYGSAQAIITDNLEYRKVSARWVPRLLTEDQKRQRLEMCKRLLIRYEAEGEAFLHRIITCDETWVHHYTPESKQASMEWRKKGESAPVKAKSRLSAGKVLATVFFDFKGVSHIDFLYKRRTVNAAYYCQLLDETKLAYRRKRRTSPIRNIILLHDNARLHTAAQTRQKIEDLFWNTLEHPPYSPDLSPCDYHLFGPLKEALGKQRFDDNVAVKAFAREWLVSQPPSFYDSGIKKLPIRLEKCISKSGDYVEK